MTQTKPAGPGVGPAPSGMVLIIKKRQQSAADHSSRSGLFFLTNCKMQVTSLLAMRPDLSKARFPLPVWSHAVHPRPPAPGPCGSR